MKVIAKWKSENKHSNPNDKYAHSLERHLQMKKNDFSCSKKAKNWNNIGEIASKFQIFFFDNRLE